VVTRLLDATLGPLDSTAQTTLGGQRIVVRADNLGVSDPTVTIGGRPCVLREEWKAQPDLTKRAEVWCTTPEGAGAEQAVVVTVAGQASTPSAGEAGAALYS